VTLGNLFNTDDPDALHIILRKPARVIYQEPSFDTPKVFICIIFTCITSYLLLFLSGKTGQPQT
jgi:hypothetical protein